ncbi:hypothetical protein POM88_031841 [Heracleum sosnowskyi]|uniref:Uncharacterized protein n=1 Tax=Heracleum sosnowskyi TaxID=360622 RepID=A0AAD8MKQ1_9APIA|nr:hypothetical protein POM88_031841 [Heracleum sosnowskyi]
MLWKEADHADLISFSTNHIDMVVKNDDHGLWRLTDAGLHDMELTGHQYTWEKGRNTDAWIEIRLVRALVNNAWLNRFPLAKLYNLEGSPSLLLEPRTEVSNGRKKRFRFENA